MDLEATSLLGEQLFPEVQIVYENIQLTSKFIFGKRRLWQM